MYLIGVTGLNYVVHKACIRKTRASERKDIDQENIVALSWRKDDLGRQDKIFLDRATKNRAWLKAVSHNPNRTKSYQEELRDNI